MGQNIIVSLIVLLAAGYLLRSTFRVLSGRGGSCGGCSKGGAVKPGVQLVELRGGGEKTVSGR